MGRSLLSQLMEHQRLLVLQLTPLTLTVQIPYKKYWLKAYETDFVRLEHIPFLLMRAVGAFCEILLPDRLDYLEKFADYYELPLITIEQPTDYWQNNAREDIVAQHVVYK